MYSYGPPHMAKQKQDDQLEDTYSSYVRIRDVALKTCQRRWIMGRSGERGSEISVLAARHDDDEFKLINSAVIFAVARDFIDLTLNRHPHIIIKEVGLWEVSWPDVKGNEVTEIFEQATLCSLAYVAWRRRHSLDPGQHYFFHALDTGIPIGSEAMWVDELRYKITIASDYQNPMIWTRCLISINMNINLSLTLKSLYWCFCYKCPTVQNKSATVVEGDKKALFSIDTIPRCRGGRYSFPGIAPLYPWYVP